MHPTAMKLRYVEHIYGPYADNLNKVLERLEGHYTRGYSGDRSPDVEIELLPGAVDDADRFLQPLTDSRARLRRVEELIEGFETPYGMELLASVHWLAVHRESAVTTSDQALRELHGWNERKKQVFQAPHVRVAWERLEREAWLPKAA